MKKIYFVIILQTLLINCYGQNFEGNIAYKITYKDTSANFTHSSVDTEYFKDGNLKVISTDSVFQWALYINAENRWYTKFVNSDTIKWTDGSLNHDSIISIQMNKNVVKILGYDCDELIMTCHNAIKKYYYSSSNFKIDGKQFIKYRSGNWTDFLLITNSLPLMQTEDRKNTHTQIVAIGAEEIKLDEAFFKLPANSIVVKSEY